MRTPHDIFNAIIQADKLEAAVQELSDAELRTLRGALARGEISSWSAGLLHGVCIVEGCERFMSEETRGRNPEARETTCDRCHGSEVRL